MPYKDLQKQRQYQLAYLKKRRQEWFDINGPCRYCGSDSVLELHHLDSRTKITHRVWSWSKERREVELSKCIVLCSVCHLKVTIQQLSKPVCHGTHNAYASGCRCDDCRHGQKLYMRLYSAKTKKAPIV